MKINGERGLIASSSKNKDMRGWWSTRKRGRNWACLNAIVHRKWLRVGSVSYIFVAFGTVIRPLHFHVRGFKIAVRLWISGSLSDHHVLEALTVVKNLWSVHNNNVPFLQVRSLRQAELMRQSAVARSRKNSPAVSGRRGGSLLKGNVNTISWEHAEGMLRVY